jgi:hypothetical protein
MKLMLDQKYMGLVAKSAKNFIPGSLHDEIWRLLKSRPGNAVWRCYLRQNVGVNSTAKVIISMRPRNIAAIQIQLWKSLSAA